MTLLRRLKQYLGEGSDIPSSYRCQECGAVFDVPRKGFKADRCPKCGSSDIVH